jgi:hypothetical protein
MKPYIERFEHQTETSFDVVIHCENCQTATEYARGYFGDYRGDFRNRNRVEYLYSDFDGNHTYHVTLNARA